MNTEGLLLFFSKTSGKQLKSITFFVWKNIAKKNENILLFMKKFPKPLLITCQVENWALWFCSLSDFPGKLWQECFIFKEKPGQHGEGSGRKGNELTQDSGSQTWVSISFSPHLCLGRSPRNLLSFFETNSSLILLQLVLRPHLQKLWQGWISSHWPYVQVRK